MEPMVITTMEEYTYCESRGYIPLINKLFTLEIAFRITIQDMMFGDFKFGGDNIPIANQLFYRWVWEHKKHVCEECMTPLHDYSAIHISHIKSKGANPEMAHDPRNTNILCFWCHNKWENGNRGTMRIYPGNKKIIEQLRNEYKGL